MRLLILTHQGNLAGSTQSIAFLAAGLARRGHQVWAAIPPGTLLNQMLHGTGVTCVPVHYRGSWDFTAARTLARLIKKEGIQLACPQSTKDRYAMLWARLFMGIHIPVVHVRRQMPESLGGWLQRLLITLAADRVVAVSQGVARGLMAKGVPKAKLVVIPNGTPAAKYANLDPQRTAELRQRYDLPEGTRVVGCVSRRKRQYQLLQALPLLPPDVTLVLVGVTQPQIAELYEQWVGTPPPAVAQRVIYTGPVPPSETLQWYPIFTVHALPSITEGLSQSLLEAMALGVPVAAAAAAGNLDLIKDGENGLLFPDADPAALAQVLNRLLADAPLRQKLAEAGRHTALIDFSVEKTVDGYEKLFHMLATQ